MQRPRDIGLCFHLVIWPWNENRNKNSSKNRTEQNRTKIPRRIEQKKNPSKNRTEPESLKMDRLSVLPSVGSVRAIFDFKGENNDELCLKQGDIITLTRTPEGGWYEGTLNDMTGWFPSNYVEAIETSSSPVNEVHSDDLKSSIWTGEKKSLICTAENGENRRMVVKEIIDSETSFIQEITNVYQSYLVPLHETNM